MATLASLIKERKGDLRELNKLLRTVDSSLEKTQRKIKRLISRAKKVPEIQDLEDITLLGRDIDSKLDGFINGLAAAARAWTI